MSVCVAGLFVYDGITDSLTFSTPSLPRVQGMSETFSTLHNLVHKGVKVVMDIPYELWNETSAEVADLKKQVYMKQKIYEKMEK